MPEVDNIYTVPQCHSSRKYSFGVISFWLSGSQFFRVCIGMGHCFLCYLFDLLGLLVSSVGIFFLRFLSTFGFMKT